MFKKRIGPDGEVIHLLYVLNETMTIYMTSKPNNAIWQSQAHNLVTEDEDTGIGKWQHANNISLCNRAKELQFR